MKKKGLLVLLAVATVLTGCGGGETDTSKNKTNTGSSISKENKSTDKPKDTPTATKKKDKTEFDEDLCDVYYGATEYGLAQLWIHYPDEWDEIDFPVEISIDNTSIESDSLLTIEGNYGKFISVYSEIIPSGDTIILVTPDDKKEGWKYNEDEGTLKFGEYCFYKEEKDLLEDIKSSGTFIDGIFTEIDREATDAKNVHLEDVEDNLLFTYHPDGRLDAEVDGEWDDILERDNEYFIIDSNVYYYEETTDHRKMSSGVYDAEAGTITFRDKLLTLVQE